MCVWKLASISNTKNTQLIDLHAAIGTRNTISLLGSVNKNGVNNKTLYQHFQTYWKYPEKL